MEIWNEWEWKSKELWKKMKRDQKDMYMMTGTYQERGLKAPTGFDQEIHKAARGRPVVKEKEQGS